MIEGGGLGKVNPKDIGPSEEQEKLGVIDYLAEDESDATRFAMANLVASDSSSAR